MSAGLREFQGCGDLASSPSLSCLGAGDSSTFQEARGPVPAPPLVDDPSLSLPGSDGGWAESTVSCASVCTGYVIHTQNHLRGLGVWETYSPLRPVALQLFVKLGFLTLLRKSNQEAQIREAPRTAQQMLENAGSEGCPLGSAVLPWASS